MASLAVYLSGISVFVLCYVQFLHLADAGSECKCTCRSGGAQARSITDRPTDLIPNPDDCEDLFCCMEAPVGSRICQRIINCIWDDTLMKCVPRPELLIPWTTTTFAPITQPGFFHIPEIEMDCGVLDRRTLTCTNRRCMYYYEFDDCGPVKGSTG